ncbi:MAG: nuclease-related domain-containing protein [Pseudomonadota bacterium]
MSDFFSQEWLPWVIAGSVVAIGFVGWLIRRRGRGSDLQQVLDAIGYDRIDGVLIPNGDDGEIQIDHLLLTSRGLLIVDVKEVSGTVFGGDKLDNWTVISDQHRFTFSNPQPALYDRVAAVRHIVRQVPVEGRLVFLDGAEFTKGTPDGVTDVATLDREFRETDRDAGKFKIEAFKPHWDQIRKAALNIELGEQYGAPMKSDAD